MIVQPTIAGLWIKGILAFIGLAGIGLALLPWNDKYDPKGDDPYRYCPKEEDEW